MKKGTTYIILGIAAIAIIVLLLKPAHYFEHRGGGGGGHGGHGGGGGGHGHGWRTGAFGRRGWGRNWGWGGWNDGGWGWLDDPHYYWDPYYVTIPISYGDSCDGAALQTYKSCIDKGGRKDACARNLDANLKACQN